MKITQEADYALRIILFLCQISSGERVEARVISESENITLRFSLKILRKLTKKDLVKSFRGVKGGYMLNKDPKDITLREVVEAIDGPIYVNRCLHDEEYCNMKRTNTCKIHKALAKIQKTLREELEKVTFKELLKEKD
ncbi:RrF2 family transcriptional regulator [Tepidibacter hydrothermalis]|uniref:Rrf2 family transcriptional regulator n=1 Tax=Tepidibacter hydrothermalis TaxID=3036126 RepID=A0ABY8ECV2_9FIRM|nr:Rrf2 family transcriptional regulator [Tepidibacter hydrothermalis]WFD10751.1 Rrf2 family transcriptional regulator [Tepidibacter hydrothermalis]